MKRLYICGHSHGKKIARELLKFREILNAYGVLDLTLPNGRFEDLELPNLQELRAGDIILLFTFGNDLFKSGVKTTIQGRQNKVYHLTHFNPNSQEDFLRKYDSLAQKFKGTPAKVYLFDTFYRHIRCCQKHHDERVLDFQIEQNYRLTAFFEKNQDITVLDHLEFLGPIPARFRDFKAYAHITPDSVHFQKGVYNVIVKKLVSEIL